MTEYNMSLWDLHGKFEDSYVSFVKAIRQLAYPKHPSVAYADRGGFYQYAERIAPASIPIFIMRPLRGEMEHATQNAANRLRADGDRFVFWLDTSGWLDETDMSSDDRDFYLDETGSHSDESGSAEAREAGKRYRLMEQGNQRVAIFLHMHVCSYLAKTGEQCAFLPAEVYQGRAFEPDKQSFDRYVEGEKKRKLRKLFIDPA